MRGLKDLRSGRVRMTAANERKMGTARESAAETLKMSDIQKSGRNADEALRGLKQGDNCRTNGGKRCRNADEALRGLKPHQVSGNLNLARCWSQR